MRKKDSFKFKTMKEFVFKDYIIAGGLTFLNDKNIELRESQIKDGESNLRSYFLSFFYYSESGTYRISLNNVLPYIMSSLE